MNARHSHDSPDWYTPADYVEAAREVLGTIDLDPMSDTIANETIKADCFFVVEEDGLAQDWWGRVFLNPAGGLVAEAWRKFTSEPIDAGIWIGYSLEQLQTLQSVSYVMPLDFPMCVPKCRIAFVENEAKKAERIVRLLTKGEAPGASDAARKLAARIRTGKEPPNSPSHANYITYIGPDPHRFVGIFSQFGAVRL